jgi:hypothetical protein
MKLLPKAREAFSTLVTDPCAARIGTRAPRAPVPVRRAHPTRAPRAPVPVRRAHPYPCAARTRFKVFDSVFDSLEIREGITPREKRSGLPSLTQIDFSGQPQELSVIQLKEFQSHRPALEIAPHGR